MKRRLWQYVLPLLVLAALSVYLPRAFEIWTGGAQIALVAYFSLGPLGVVGAVELGPYLSEGQDRIQARIGTVFGVAGFVIWGPSQPSGGSSSS